MIINFFRVSPRGGLEFWVEVPEELWSNNLKISKIAIQDNKHFTTKYPENPQIEFNVGSSIEILEIDNQRSLVKFISFNDLEKFDVKDIGLFFIYVKLEGTPNQELPCEYDRDYFLDVTYNPYCIYDLASKLFRNYKDNCGEDRDKILDLYLKRIILDQAIDLKDYQLAMEIYKDIEKVDLKLGQCAIKCDSYSSTNNIINNCSKC